MPAKSVSVTIRGPENLHYVDNRGAPTFGDRGQDSGNFWLKIFHLREPLYPSLSIPMMGVDIVVNEGISFANVPIKVSVFADDFEGAEDDFALTPSGKGPEINRYRLL